MSLVFDDTVSSFFDYFYEHPQSVSGKKDANSLEECIKIWVLEEVATKACGGSFKLYLATIAVIIGVWHDARQECPSEEYWGLSIPWRIRHVFKDGRSEPQTDIFDPFFFKWSSIPG
ncbi:hypothetical protein [Amycolatopsis mediterranei]|uniref:hypothetical protein n=1 Tax=Amycolatopsis mediterranei TaxID=33910 RepID=UPI000AA1EBE4|nr:hypothetical protein [Amycolatopsis mediterranei]UZF69133.1 hypothetical protein ISP_002261 [Amycolatopsis mediterranei]